MKAEFRVLEESMIANKSVHDLESKYGIKIDHAHNYPQPSKFTEKHLKPRDIVNPYMYIKVSGPYGNVKKIVLDSTR